MDIHFCVMQELSYRDLSIQEKAVLREAERAMVNAYSIRTPYGAAIMTDDLRIFPGATVEMLFDPLNYICAERSAIITALSDGGHKNFDRIAVIGRHIEYPALPCNKCCDWLKEFSDAAGHGLTVIASNTDKTRIYRATIQDIWKTYVEQSPIIALNDH